MLKGIISLFEKDPDEENTHIEQLPMLVFAAEILAHLPYSALNDPLFIVYHATNITALDGQAIINDFAELLGQDVSADSFHWSCIRGCTGRRISRAGLLAGIVEGIEGPPPALM